MIVKVFVTAEIGILIFSSGVKVEICGFVSKFSRPYISCSNCTLFSNWNFVERISLLRYYFCCSVIFSLRKNKIIENK